MSPMYWVLLILATTPIYIFLGWLLFDTAANAASTFFETFFVVVRSILVPRYVRLFLDWDDEGGFGIFEIAIFFIACAGVTYGEHLLLQKYVFAN